ncbi:ABC transporter ATP-binding protein [Streptantibioticus silvisoli]|uniref:ABC transporter ATP-binding protein n=1 Tax=Streptantibioticus silvisoli TaxID=2705255 RepID=A0ABT6WA88_9ACTN|nr:ABC transporter ATP-binding protein [Streptantibioticus silvisoli]MDI5966651.1 ABC transporter ATP-binding protein [Streptantibioticus silvisoli]
MQKESDGGAPTPAADGQAAAFELVGLRKTFGTYEAVGQADLTVAPGSFFGLVGPNGAGKTTMLSMAVGLLRPDAGHAKVFGTDVWKEPERAKELMGVLPDGLAMPEQLTGRELLSYLGQLRGLDKATVAGRVDELLAVLELSGDTERTLILDYSTGMRKKIGLAVALLHGPRLLVLDEPFEAVDPVAAAMLKRLLKRFVAGGGSVLLSSHVMALVEQMCDTVAVMAKGNVVAQGPLDQVRGGVSLEERFVELVGVGAENEEGLSWLAR